MRTTKSIRQERIRTIRKGIEERKFVNTTLRNYRKNGELFYNDLFLTPVDSNGVFAGFIGVQNDVTDRVLAQRELRQRGRLLQGFFDSAPMLMAVVRVGRGELETSSFDGGRGQDYGAGEFDRLEQTTHDLLANDGEEAAMVAGNTRHIVMNDAAVAHYGVNREEVEGVTLDHLGFDAAGRRSWATALARAAQTGKPQRFEATRESGDDRFRLSVTVGPVKDGSTHRGTFCYLAQDVTLQRSLERQVLDAQERERERLGRDLHDTVAQQLQMLTLLVGNARAELLEHASPDAGVIEQLGEAIEQASLAAKQARDLSHTLGAVDIHERGLARGLELLASRVQLSYGCTVSVDANADAEPVSQARAVQLFRIAGEATANAARHAKPSAIAIRLQEDDDGRALLTVDDDGSGIPDQAIAGGGADGGTGIGINSMGYRAALIGGTFGIGRRSTGGTRVSVRFPIAGA